MHRSVAYRELHISTEVDMNGTFMHAESLTVSAFLDVDEEQRYLHSQYLYDCLKIVAYRTKYMMSCTGLSKYISIDQL